MSDDDDAENRAARFDALVYAVDAVPCMEIAACSIRRAYCPEATKCAFVSMAPEGYDAEMAFHLGNVH